MNEGMNGKKERKEGRKEKKMTEGRYMKEG